MILQLLPQQVKELKGWFPAEQPGYLVGQHVVNTGCGRIWADRFPNPRAVLAETAGNLQLYGDPQAFRAEDLEPLLKGFLDCPPAFEPLVRAACSDLTVWEREVYRLEELRPVKLPDQAILRRLEAVDAPALEKLSPASAWVTKTWGGAAGAAASGAVWGAFIEGRLASLAAPFFVGNEYEDLGVATEPAFRGWGLSTACTFALCQDVVRHGKQVSWNTSTDNPASIRVAEKVGFRLVRHDRLLVAGVEMPDED